MNFLNTDPQPIDIKPRFTATKILLGLSLVILIASAGAATYFYKQWNDLKANPAKVSSDETKNLVQTVGKLILLPTGEDPTVATVTDPAKLKDQAFFANAKTGYKVLVYTKAKTAYLYDPVQNKIINVSPINTDSNNTAQTSGTSTTTGTTTTPPQK